jgi:IS5 family transposase
MFLKYRYRLGFETLCAEVTDSISWRRFARIDIDGKVPHPTTLMKITTRCGEQAIAGLNETLIAKAAQQKLVKTGIVRADTTVVSANVKYPTDSGLLARAVSKIGKLVGRVKAAGGATRTGFRNRTWATSRRVHAIGAKLKLRGAAARDQAQAQVLRITGELAEIAHRSAADAAVVVRNARRAFTRGSGSGRAAGTLRRAVDELATTIARAGQVIAQTRVRLAGDKPDSATRLVSLHDPDARPIAKGRVGKPVEFGYKAQVLDNEDGIVLDHTVEQGNPPDAPQLAPAARQVTNRLGKPPAAATADRGYGEAGVENDLHALGVKTVAIPRKGKPSQARHEQENRPGFRKLIKWRTGSEGRISHLKHGYGWDRTRLDGLTGARIWCGHGILAQNLVKVTALAQAHAT